MNFNNRCYQLVSQIPKGKVSTYKGIANTLNTKAYRAVGNAMSNSPNLIITPCHRVIKTDGSVGGYALGITKKISLLKNEGIAIQKGKVLDFEQYIYTFE